MAVVMETPTSLCLSHNDLSFFSPNNSFIRNQRGTAKIELKHYLEIEEEGSDILLTVPHLCSFSGIDHILSVKRDGITLRKYQQPFNYKDINNSNITQKDYAFLLEYILNFMPPEDYCLVDYLLQEILQKKEISFEDYNTIDDDIVETILLNSQECTDFLSILPNLHCFSHLFDDIINTIETDSVDYFLCEHFQSLKKVFHESFNNIKLK